LLTLRELERLDETGGRRVKLGGTIKRPRRPFFPSAQFLERLSLIGLAQRKERSVLTVPSNAVPISDTGLGKLSVANDLEAVLRRIEYRHQGSIAAFKIIYRDEHVKSA
jgi:hypothetical protein